jgi:enoyl-CoA hydratase
MIYESICVEEPEDGMGLITLNRPEQMNPLDWGTIKELKSSVGQFEEKNTVHVVVITGKGRAFSAGADMQQLIHLYKNPDDYREYLKDFSGLFHMIEQSSKVYIGAVNGYCLAGGLGILLVCDMVVASEEAQIGDAHLNFAQPIAAGMTQRLPRAIGFLDAKYLFFTGDLLTARDAERIGLVNRVVPASQLLVTSKELARKVLCKSPKALKLAKKLVNEGRKLDLRTALDMEMGCVHQYATTSEDPIEGLMAFMEKRKPRFKGC